MLLPNVSFEMNMLFHSVVIAFLLYMILHCFMNYPRPVAQKYSLVVGFLVLIYMLVFGHQLPRFGVMYY
jgi:hypothetical protein